MEHFEKKSQGIPLFGKKFLMQNPLTMLSGKSRLQKHETPTPRNRGQKAVLRAAWGHTRAVLAGTLPTRGGPPRPPKGALPPLPGTVLRVPLEGQRSQAQASTTQPGIFQTHVTVETAPPPPGHLLIFFPAPLGNILLNTNGLIP